MLRSTLYFYYFCYYLIIISIEWKPSVKKIKEEESKSKLNKSLEAVYKVRIIHIHTYIALFWRY